MEGRQACVARKLDKTMAILRWLALGLRSCGGPKNNSTKKICKVNDYCWMAFLWRCSVTT